MTQELEKTLWAAADKLRNNMDAAEYKHVVLGLIFLNYISDRFEELQNRLKEDPYADPEDKDEYLAENVFYVPPSARWSYLQYQRAKLPSIGKDIDDAMDAIELDNPSLKGVLPKDYARPSIDKKRLGELVDMIGNVGFNAPGQNSKDLLGRVFEYFLGMFADAEGKRGGQFYTPESIIVKLLVEMLEPYSGRIYDGCCGSGGMFVQSEKFLQAHGGKIGNIAVYGQESNPTTYKLAKMNLAIRGIDAKIELGDTFHNDRHKDLKVDYIIANPPFNISDWGGEQLQDSQVVDIFDAAGLKKPDISILSDDFLAEVKGMQHKNVALELLKKLLNDEIKTRKQINLVQSKMYSEMLDGAVKNYQNNLITSAQIIDEMIKLAKAIKEADRKGEDLGLDFRGYTFYTALEVNDSAVNVLGDEILKHIARELVDTIRKNTSIDWTVRENVQAKMRIAVKRILRKHGYPPDRQEQATETVLEQARMMADYINKEVKTYQFPPLGEMGMATED